MDQIEPNKPQDLFPNDLPVVLNIIKNNPGSLWHYGHFIHDFIIPMIYYINKHNINYNHIYLNYKSSDYRLGTFKGMAEKLLGIPITEIKKKEIEELGLKNSPSITINTLGFGPYNKFMFNYNIPHIKRRLELHNSPYKIILIERGKTLLKNDIIDTGANRRSISNHNKLNYTLSSKFGSIFKNVILEKMTIEEQVSLFMNARIIIGQHGAGLCNIIWIENPNSLIIEFPPYLVNTFKNMCTAIGFDYLRLKTNINTIVNICIDRLKKYSIEYTELSNVNISLDKLNKHSMKYNKPLNIVESVVNVKPIINVEPLFNIESTPVIKSKPIIESNPVIEQTFVINPAPVVKPALIKPSPIKPVISTTLIKPVISTVPINPLITTVPINPESDIIISPISTVPIKPESVINTEPIEILNTINKTESPDIQSSTSNGLIKNIKPHNSKKIIIQNIKSRDLEVLICKPMLNIIKIINNHAIIPYIRGNLSNQMFIVSAGYIVSILLNKPLYLIYNLLDTNKINYNTTIFKEFGIQTNAIFKKTLLSDNIINVLQENNYTIHDISDENRYDSWNISSDSKGVVMGGLYQYYPIIKLYENILGELFIKGLEAEYFNINKQIRIDSLSTAFLHICYFKKNIHLDKQLDISYYKECVDKMIKINNIKKIIVITNSINYIINNEYFKEPIFHVLYTENELTTLAVMTLCKGGAICTYSLLSWWGALIGAHKNKNPVFIPKIWKQDNLFPEDWYAI